MNSTDTRLANSSQDVDPGEVRRRPKKAKRDSRSGTRIEIHVYQLLVVLAALSIWQFGADRWFDQFFTSTPLAIADSWLDMVLDGRLWYHMIATLTTVVYGFAIGASVALILGYVFASARRVGAVFEPFVIAIYSIPKIALIPLFVMWIGTGQPLAVLISAVITFFLMFYNTYFGVRDVDSALIDSVRIMGGNRWDLAVRVRFPSALVWVAAGLKVSIPQALVGVVVAEILAGNRGLGYLVQYSAGSFNSAATFAALFTLMVIGIALGRLAAYLTNRSLVWRKQELV